MTTKVAGALVAFLIALAFAGGMVAGSPPSVAAECEEGAILPAEDGTGTYSRCISGVWVHIDQQLCVDFPEFAPNCVAPPETTTSSSPTPVPPPVVAPPPVVVDTPYVPVPNVPNLSAPGIGCTWVNGYTKKNGTSVRGHWRC